MSKPTGTGPFVFGEFAQGDHLTLNKNLNYWDTGKPYVDQLQFRIFTDPEAMMMEFERTLDLARGAVYSIGGNYLDVTAAWLA